MQMSICDGTRFSVVVCPSVKWLFIEVINWMAMKAFQNENYKTVESTAQCKRDEAKKNELIRI